MYKVYVKIDGKAPERWFTPVFETNKQSFTIGITNREDMDETPRESAQFMCDMMGKAIESIIDKVRNER